VGQFFDLGNFVANNRTYEAIVVDFHTMQVIQIVNFFETKAKTIFDVGCDHFGPSMAIILSIHALHI
jgi:hypothetical protein